MRKLASIQRIESVKPIEGADRIQKARVLGWDVVVRKDDFVVGDLCVFFEIDSLLPERDWSAFMEPMKYRVKTQRLRGVLSQGLALPLDVLPALAQVLFPIGEDVTALLGVTKYELPMLKSLEAKAFFPAFISKTQERRVQSCPGVLDDIKGVPLVATVKLDGQSATYANLRDEFFVCSMSIQLKEGKNNQFWNVAKRYKLADVLPDGIAIQGEVCGPGIRKNRLGLKKLDLFVFNVFDIKTGIYFNHYNVCEFCRQKGLTMVPEAFRMTFANGTTVEYLLRLAEGKYEGTNQAREGLVFRPLRELYSEALQGRLSFKVVNNDYLLKRSDRGV